jgi:hypothetical protein
VSGEEARRLVELFDTNHDLHVDEPDLSPPLPY